MEGDTMIIIARCWMVAWSTSAQELKKAAAFLSSLNDFDQHHHSDDVNTILGSSWFNVSGKMCSRIHAQRSNSVTHAGIGQSGSCCTWHLTGDVDAKCLRIQLSMDISFFSTKRFAVDTQSCFKLGRLYWNTHQNFNAGAVRGTTWTIPW